jgi:hypothetical protein
MCSRSSRSSSMRCKASLVLQRARSCRLNSMQQSLAAGDSTATQVQAWRLSTMHSSQVLQPMGALLCTGLLQPGRPHQHSRQPHQLLAAGGGSTQAQALGARYARSAFLLTSTAACIMICTSAAGPWLTSASQWRLSASSTCTWTCLPHTPPQPALTTQP